MSAQMPEPSSQRITIAVDIDEVLVPHRKPLIERLCEISGVDVEMEGITTLNELLTLFEHSPEEIHRQIHEFLESEEFAALEPIEESIAAIEELKKHFDLQIVTARPGIMQRMTKEWLEQHFPDTFADVHFSNEGFEWATADKVSKLNACQTIGAQYLIDDTLKHIEEVVACGMKGILFGDYEWNQVESLPPNTVRATNWDEAVTYLLQHAR